MLIYGAASGVVRANWVGTRGHFEYGLSQWEECEYVTPSLIGQAYTQYYYIGILW